MLHIQWPSGYSFLLIKSTTYSTKKVLLLQVKCPLQLHMKFTWNEKNAWLIQGQLKFQYVNKSRLYQQDLIHETQKTRGTLSHMAKPSALVWKKFKRRFLTNSYRKNNLITTIQSWKSVHMKSMVFINSVSLGNNSYLLILNLTIICTFSVHNN